MGQLSKNKGGGVFFFSDVDRDVLNHLPILCKLNALLASPERQGPEGETAVAAEGWRDADSTLAAGRQAGTSLLLGSATLERDG